MRKLITILFICLLKNSFATNYYVATSGGDAAAGTSPATAWGTIAKVNSSTFSPGDSILFKRGDIFYGTINISNSGSSGNPITFGAYGSGANPIISGFTMPAADWTDLGSNIWESTNPVSTLTGCNMVVIDGVNTPMGRYPNTGYLTYQSHSGNTTITSSSLTGTPDWTGASVVIKKIKYVITSGTITAQSGGTLTYTDDAYYTPTDGFGLFIQNDSRTLDEQNEWYYDPSTKKIKVYSTSMPDNVSVASVSNNIVVTGAYITIENLDLTGANGDAISISSTNHVTVQNCNISFAGINAVYAPGCPYTAVNNNNVYQCNNWGIFLNNESANAIVTNNKVRNIGLINGMTQTYSVGAITAYGNNSLIQYNSIDSVGFMGIDFAGEGSSVLNNLVNHACITKDDGGGIYTSDNKPDKVILGNIVLNTAGCIEGTPDGDYAGYGIYLDSYCSHYIVQGNTVANCNAAGGFFSNLDSNIIRDNTFYNNALLGGFGAQSQVMFEYICCNNTRKNLFNNNLLFTKDVAKNAMFMFSNYTTDDISEFGTADSNYYVNPSGGKLFSTQYNTTITDRNFVNWKTYMGWDANSQSIIKSSGTLDSVLFVYNSTTSPVTTQLSFKYIDVKGNIYNGSITLAPYTSAVLIADGLLNFSGQIKLSGNFKLNNEY